MLVRAWIVSTCTQVVDVNFIDSFVWAKKPNGVERYTHQPILTDLTDIKFEEILYENIWTNGTQRLQEDVWHVTILYIG